MKSFLHLSGVAALALALAPVAFAGSITIGSYGSANPNPGFSNAALQYLGSSGYQVAGGVLSAPGGVTTPGSPATQNLPVTSTWQQAIGISNWVSFEPSGPAGPYTPKNDYYYYSTTFDASAGQYSGSLSLLADDTAEVFLNNQLIVTFANIANDSHCAIGGNGPTCGFYGSTSAVWTVALDVTLEPVNSLVIIDAQTGAGPAGLDFESTLSSAISDTTPREPPPVSLPPLPQVVTPEPGSLLLLGTGLAFLAFTILCKSRLA